MDIRVIGLSGLIGGVLACGTVAQAAVLKVPQQYATIQAAVNAAQEGDTVRVAAGTYAEHVFISGKAIALVGAGAEQTTIDAAHTGRPITVYATGTGQVTVANFTLTNGQLEEFNNGTLIGNDFGGGAFALQASVTLANNVITNNLGCVGTSVAAWDATITLTRNRVENNPGNPHCGQQSVFILGNRGGESTISGNVFRDHNITAVHLHAAGKVTVSNNIFRNNIADWENLGLEQGALLSNGTEITLTNNLFAGNYGLSVGAAAVSESGTGVPVRISGNTFIGNSTGPLGAASLQIGSIGPPEQTILKSNQFDESVDRPAISCGFGVVVDASNVFASGRDAALSGLCEPAQ
jgi:hypothetical protein